MTPQTLSNVIPLGSTDAQAESSLIDLNELKRVQDMIESGLPDSQARIDDAKTNDAYYALLNSNYIPKREAETDNDYARRPKRTVRLVKKAVDTLGRRLYHPGPSRKLTSEDSADNETTLDRISEWLEHAYKAAKLNSILDAANKRAILNHASAVQVAATGDPAKPLKFWVYSGAEFETFCTPDDPTTPWAVVTVTIKSTGPQQQKRVYTLYTAENEYTYETKPYSLFLTAGGIRAKHTSTRAHGYGCLPFAFFHNETPVDRFWCGGIGTALRETNAELDEELSDLAEQIQKFSCPDMFARNVAANFRYEKRPGRPQLLKQPESVAQGEAVMGPPEVFYVQPQINVEEVWRDVEKTTTRLFADLDVPITASWDNNQAPTSGLQVIAQDAPYMEYLQNRQLVAKTVESELAKIALTVAGNHYNEPGFLAAADVAEMELEFPAPVTLVPTPERNQDMEWRIQWGMMSQIEGIMQQRGVTRDAAEKIAAQIAEDRALIQSLMGDTATPTPLPDPGAPDPNAGIMDATQPQDQQPSDATGATS